MMIDSMDFKEGEVLLFDKPYGWTSFFLVKKIRWHICQMLKIKKLKVGHAGTLDPLASGLMIVCTGKATKTIESYMGKDKEYIADIRLGQTTPSFDLETEIDNELGIEGINKEKIMVTLKKFEGLQKQVPPLFSAINVNGKRAYDYARKGENVDLKKREIRISGIELLECDLPDIRLRINCSKGTYIRSLARDIGENLGCGAHLTALKRTKIGDFDVENAFQAEDFIEKLKSE